MFILSILYTVYAVTRDDSVAQSNHEVLRDSDAGATEVEITVTGATNSEVSSSEDSEDLEPLDYLGAEGCKCLTLEEFWQKVPPAKTKMPLRLDFKRSDDTIIELSPAFGTFCNAWDQPIANLGLPIWENGDCSVQKQHSWCQDTFCYVDPCDCDRPDVKMTGQWDYLGNKMGHVWYSYSTCARCEERTETECKAHTHCDWDPNVSSLKYRRDGVCVEKLNHDYTAAQCEKFDQLKDGETKCKEHDACSWDESGKCVVAHKHTSKDSFLEQKEMLGCNK